MAADRLPCCERNRQSTGTCDDQQCQHFECGTCHHRWHERRPSPQQPERASGERDRVLEEAARACEAQATIDGQVIPGLRNELDCAAAIRALKTAHPETPAANPGEPERTAEQERAAVVAYVREALSFGHGKDCYCPLCQEVPDVAAAIERGDHLSTPKGSQEGGDR